MEICSNERIPYLKLEKVIKKDLHVDTDEEKAQKMKSLIDKVQDKQIAKNREDIEKTSKIKLDISYNMRYIISISTTYEERYHV